MIRKLRLTACVAGLLVAAATAAAQPPCPVPPPFLPVPPLPGGIVPCAAMAPGCQGYCVCAPAPAACAADRSTAGTTVAELMRLYRMLYRQGKHQEAAAVATQVMELNPIVGRTAFALVLAARGRSEAARTAAPCGCCPACGESCACPACCGTTCQAAKDCACGAGCKCCDGDKSACACGKSCKCSAPKPTACRNCVKMATGGCVGVAFGPCMPGMGCPLPLPVTVPPWPPLPTPVARMVVGCPTCTAAAFPYPLANVTGSVTTPVPTCCCPAVTAPRKPVKHPACAGCRTCQAAEVCDVRTEECVPVRITAAGNRVRITTSAVEVECDRVTALSREGRVRLEGNVSVEFRTQERPATISAEEVSVSLRDGSYAINCRSAAAGSWKPEANCGSSGTTAPAGGETPDWNELLRNVYWE